MQASANNFKNKLPIFSQLFYDEVGIVHASNNIYSTSMTTWIKFAIKGYWPVQMLDDYARPTTTIDIIATCHKI